MLKPSDLTIGQEVVVTNPAHRSTDTPMPIRAEVTKIGRVWVILSEIAPREGRHICEVWRMRLDTQDTGNRDYSHWNSHFYTLDQWTEHERQTRASQILREAHVSVDFKSRYYHDQNFRVALADFIFAWDKEHPAE